MYVIKLYLEIAKKFCFFYFSLFYNYILLIYNIIVKFEKNILFQKLKKISNYGKILCIYCNRFLKNIYKIYIIVIHKKGNGKF